MFRQLIAWALGPSGMLILEWYTEHSLVINGTIVTLAILALLFPRQRDRVQAFVGNLWARTPFVLSEKDHEAVERVREQYRLRRLGGKPK